MNLLDKTPDAKTPEKEAGILEWFMDDFWPKFGMQTVYVLVGIAVIVAGFSWYTNDRVQRQAKENKELGQAYIYYNEEKLDSAEAFLKNFLKSSHSRLVQDKANLMYGQIHYGRGNFDEAAKAFSQVDLSNTAHPLISSGALHGLAACQIQKKEFAKAAENLEAFVSRFGRKTGNPSENVAGKEVADLSPAVPNALWKLTLVYRELKNSGKELATAKKLAALYPQAREAFDANRLIAQIP